MLKGLNLMVLMWKHIEKCGTKGTQMTIGTTTIGQEENRTMSQVSQGRDTMAIIKMEETTTVLTIDTVTQVKIVCTTGEDHLLNGGDDPEEYLKWALKVDKIFRVHNYSEAKKVAMA